MPEATVYLGSVLLEPNRWKRGKEPTFKVSAWTRRAKEAGFDGLELWENHYVKADEAERAALRDSPCPVRLFNTYAPFTEAGRADGERAREAVEALKAVGCKFNAGNDVKRTREYLDEAARWAERLPDGARPLCECHGGTVLETPEAAEGAFNGPWRDARFGAIVHPFTTPPDVLRAWMRRLKARVVHAHVQLRDREGKYLRLEKRPREVEEALAILHDGGFRGTFTLEFTEGTRTPDDRPDVLFGHAAADLKYLRARWLAA